MIVRQFLFWLRSAPAGERAEATAALARAYLYSDLSNDDLAAAEGAMTMLLDDPSPLVRAAMADVLAASEYAPASVIYALAADQPEIAVVILERSPLLLDAELVDAVATHGAIAQSAVARRAHLPRSVAAAIAEVGTAEACLELVENPGADIAPFSIERLVERFGHLAAIREVLLARSDLPASVRQALVATLSRTLAEFVITREWLTCRSRSSHRQGSLRKGHRRAGRIDRQGRGASADPSPARKRPAHRRPDPAGAAVRQHGDGRGGAGGTVRHDKVPRLGADPGPGRGGVARALSQGWSAGLGLSGLPRSGCDHARRRFPRRSVRHARVSSAA